MHEPAVVVVPLAQLEPSAFIWSSLSFVHAPQAVLPSDEALSAQQPAACFCAAVSAFRSA